MKRIPSDAINFFEKQNFAIIASSHKDGSIHVSCKGILRVEPKGKIYILDLYKARTYRNIKSNKNVALTAVDESKFRGYAIEGEARIIKEDALPKKTVDIWHEKLAKRIARRVISHVKYGVSEDKVIPEARFPLPKYAIEVTVNRIVNLAPHKI